MISTTGDAPPAFFSRAAPSNMSVGGKASLQPKRTPLSQEEIEAIMVRKGFLLDRCENYRNVNAIISEVHSHH